MRLVLLGAFATLVLAGGLVTSFPVRRGRGGRDETSSKRWGRLEKYRKKAVCFFVSCMGECVLCARLYGIVWDIP